MIKSIKILIINLFIISFLLVTTELILLYKDYNINIFSPNYFFRESFRKSAILKEPKKKSIIVLGCSFFNDIFLDEEEIAPHLISKLTERNVYNFAVHGGSPVDALYIMQNYDLILKINEINKDYNIDHIIYNYMPWHLKALKYCTKNECVRYKKNKNNELILHNTPIYNFRIAKMIERNIATNNSEANETQFDLFKLYMTTIKKQIQKNFGKETKFTILVVKEWGFEDWEQLKKEGVNVINLNEILGFNINTREYAISDTNGHPNEKAWKVIVPALIKELDL